MSDDMIWIGVFEQPKPSTPGWYGVQYGWFDEGYGYEGPFPEAVYFDGDEWKNNMLIPISYFSSLPFETRNEAHTWADENCPEY